MRDTRPGSAAKAARRDEFRLRELDRKARTAAGNAAEQITAAQAEAANVPVFAAYQLAEQTIPSNAMTAILLHTVTLDTHDGFDPGVSRSRYVCPLDGVYSASGVVIVLGVGGGGKRAAAIAVNGSRWPGGTSIIPAAGVGDVTVPTPRKEIPLRTGDYVEVWAFQDSGGPLVTFASADTTSALDIAYRRPLPSEDPEG